MSSALHDLRPMSIGELLDRAFTISIKNLVPFMAIVAVVLVPELVVNYYLFQGPFSIFDSIYSSMTGTAVPDTSKVFSAYANGAPYLVTLFAFALFLVPLSNAAVVSGVSRAYLGLPVRFADCYRDALPRWLSLVLLGLLWVVAGGVMLVATSMGFVFIGMAMGALGTLLGSFGAIVAIVMSIVIFLGIIVLALALYLSAIFSFVASVLERLSPDAAFGSGFRRVFGERQFGRSLGIAGALFGIWIGFAIVGAVLGYLTLSVTHSTGVQLVVAGVVNAFIYPFVFAVVAVSYYDVRIRREGYDLQMLATQLGRSAPSNVTPP